MVEATSKLYTHFFFMTQHKYVHIVSFESIAVFFLLTVANDVGATAAACHAIQEEKCHKK